jgi:hypothetical protein
VKALLGFGINLCDICKEIKNTARVTPFVVVPGDEFDEVLVEGDTGLGIKDRRVCVTIQVSRDDFVLGIGEYACTELEKFYIRNLKYLPFNSPSAAFFMTALISS